MWSWCHYCRFGWFLWSDEQESSLLTRSKLLYLLGVSDYTMSVSYQEMVFFHILTTVRGMQILAYCVLLIQCFPMWVIRRIFDYTCVPHWEDNSMGGPPLFDAGIWNQRECCERQSFCPNWESNQRASPCKLSFHPIKKWWIINPVWYRVGV